MPQSDWMPMSPANDDEDNFFHHEDVQNGRSMMHVYQTPYSNKR